MATTIKKSDEVLALIQQACARRELLILAGPFLRFESTFVGLHDGELHVLATMSREDAVFGLRTPDLKIRFPDGLGFYEAPVEMRGLGMLEGRRTLRLSIPKAVTENDQRVAYRVERVGRVMVTFSTPRNQIHLASLVDISTTGARLHAQKDLEPEDLKPGDRLSVTIPLSEEILVNATGQVRHVGTRRLGVEFLPLLKAEVQEPLSRWVFLRREEDRERAARRLELSQKGLESVAGTGPAEGVLLVSADPMLEEVLREVLKGIQSMARVSPAIQAIKDAFQAKPALVIFHLNGAGLDERRRMKTLVEGVHGKTPVLLLGTQVDGATLFELASEWKASSAMVWSPQRGPFLERLAQGIIRRHRDGGDSPLAPPEP